MYIAESLDIDESLLTELFQVNSAVLNKLPKDICKFSQVRKLQPGAEVTYFVTNNAHLMKMGSLEFTKNFLMNVNGMYTAADYVSRKAKLATRRVS